MQLFIVRHGIAIDREDPKCPPDPERFLTEEGIEKTRQAAKGVAEIGAVPDSMLSSPYIRAAQTAEIFAAVLEYPKQKIQKTELSYPVPSPSSCSANCPKTKTIPSSLSSATLRILTI